MNQIKKAGVVGSGTMGAGIVQLLIQNGHPTVMFDINQEAVDRARTGIEARLERLVEKQKISVNELTLAKELLESTTDINAFKDCQLVIEAAPEKIGIKRSIFQQLEEICAEDTILATNTSSLSITEISGQIKKPTRVAGLHFFNPAPIMPLVEVIQGLKTSPEVTETLIDFAKKINKNPVVCKDTPGFIVNRVARPFYNEALRIMNDQVASVEQIDRIMKGAGNFKMGPFELQDLIGIDINFATTKSVHAGFHGEDRFRPHYYQERMVQSGSLGRKTKGGFFSYDE
ncbi:3-hydroxyacyl-CoA dehydrogenase NAD-binding domain-containing protein [Halalkalibacter krulwichiae]|uniref:3-hydroxyadipyl-CoA dehydrogenase n=1 Tax=Halalkalibacter krulwichiae TaxID=199441 RepID=A0A1X9M631_9BACI|nr:3-hydroxyacyl-CoA dehydrogenase NAD-binding domain-containing protein [Halalkalibacter krulwichiae]ARK28908.1 3-hydroxyadipyl-CoA dehydrogenase [Halalkalibacter krulwichiae]